MRPYDPAQVLISLHIPKTAGTSFRHDLERWFGRENMAYHYRGNLGEAPARAEPRGGLCIHGHFNRLRDLGARQYYPAAGQFIVFLREPFDRFVSAWRYLHFQVRSGVPVPELDDRPSFETWMHRRRRAAESGEDPFSYLAQLADPCAPADPERVFDAGYLGVGVTERYQDSTRLFAAVLGQPAPEAVTRLNLHSDAHRSGEVRDQLSGWRAEYERSFPLEYAVYEAGIARLDRGLRDL